MYYQFRTHAALPVSSTIEAAKLIKEQQLKYYHAICCDLPQGKKAFFVDDTDEGDFGEVAVLIQDGDSFTQVESITAGWIKSTGSLAIHFNYAIANNALHEVTHLHFMPYQS